MIWAKAFIDDPVVQHGINNGLSPFALILSYSASQSAKDGIDEATWLVKTALEKGNQYYRLLNKQEEFSTSKEAIMESAINDIKNVGLWPW